MILKIIFKNKKYYFIIFLNKKIFLQNNVIELLNTFIIIHVSTCVVTIVIWFGKGSELFGCKIN